MAKEDTMVYKIGGYNFNIFMIKIFKCYGYGSFLVVLCVNHSYIGSPKKRD